MLRSRAEAVPLGVLLKLALPFKIPEASISRLLTKAPHGRGRGGTGRGFRVTWDSACMERDRFGTVSSGWNLISCMPAVNRILNEMTVCVSSMRHAYSGLADRVSVQHRTTSIETAIKGRRHIRPRSPGRARTERMGALIRAR